jgi:ssDNA-binding Zn-finger/Zn-ribbon topoisomerase 1
MHYKEVLARFWRDFSAAIAETSELRISEVLDVLDEALAPQLYPPREDGSDPRACPKCGNGRLHLKTSRTGGFVGCGNYPECRYTRPIAGEGAEGGDRVLGEDAGDEIWLRSGRFGPYVQRGEATPEETRSRRAPRCPRAGTSRRRHDAGKGADAAEPAARDGHASRWRPISEFRPLRALHHAPAARRGEAGLRQPQGSQRRVRDRHEPRGRAAGGKARQPGPRADGRGGQTAARAGRAPRRRRRRQRHGGPLRALREVGKGQRHAAQGPRKKSA